MSAPNPGAVPPEQLPSSARVLWAIRADGHVVPVLVGDDGSLVGGAPALQTTADLSHAVISNAAVTVKAAASGTVLDVFNFAGNGGGVVLDFSSRPWYTTTTAGPFIIQSSAAVQVDGSVDYANS